jgi:hypothetical protein
MGRGSRRKKEPRNLSPAVNLRDTALRGEVEGTGGGTAQKESPCEMAKSLSVLFTAASAVKRGDAVKLSLGIPPAVLVAGAEVGHLQEPDASFAEACLIDGFALTGAVQSIDPVSGTGEVFVTGEKR